VDDTAKTQGQRMAFGHKRSFAPVAGLRALRIGEPLSGHIGVEEARSTLVFGIQEEWCGYASCLFHRKTVGNTPCALLATRGFSCLSGLEIRAAEVVALPPNPSLCPRAIRFCVVGWVAYDLLRDIDDAHGETVLSQ
jgi:hypothetical protein